jgi:RNA polymerase sigma-70 factor (ECF subfamily)
VALAEVHGASDGLAAVDGLDLDLDDYFLHSTRAELLRRLGRDAEAADAYDRALGLVANAAESRFLKQRRQSLT